MGDAVLEECPASFSMAALVQDSGFRRVVLPMLQSEPYVCSLKHLSSIYLYVCAAHTRMALQLNRAMFQVHFLPILLTNPSSIMRPHRALLALLAAIRSATFLSTFVSSCWLGVCFTRTLVSARLFPKISHDVWDGPYGGTLVGSLLCGTSIWIENARRRREVALYVLPKALRASISEKWLRSSHPVAQLAEW